MHNFNNDRLNWVNAMTPEEEARQEIDRLLEAAGWHVQDYKNLNLRESPLNSGGFDYLSLWIKSKSEHPPALKVIKLHNAIRRCFIHIEIEIKDISLYFHVNQSLLSRSLSLTCC
jgi:hypothetical protein